MRRAVLALSVLLVPAGVLAQQATMSFAALAREGLVNVGDEIRITCDAEGTGRYEEYTTEVRAIAEDTITIENTTEMLSDGDTVTIPAERVAAIHRPRSSRALLGTGIGAAAGFGLGYAVGEGYCRNEGGRNCDGQLQAGAGVGFAALGAGVGAAVGYAFKRDGEAVYLAPSSLASRDHPMVYSVAPIVSRQRRGILFTLAW